jgi:hypothetical protein
MTQRSFFLTRLRQTFFFIFTGCVSSSSFSSSINTYGVTGLYNIPNADVADFGDFTFSYNDVLDGDFSRDQYTRGENFSFNLGVYSNLEVNLRLLHIYSAQDHQKFVYKDFYVRDLSGNVKWQLPYISSGNWRFAIGSTDIAGLAVNFRRHYAVTSYRLGDFDFSAGYSLNPAGQRRDNGVLKGNFYGVSYQPRRWLQINAEKESSGQRAGVALTWPEFLGFAGDIHVGGIVYSSHKDELRAFNIGVTWPIGGRNPGSDRMSAKTPSAKPSPLSADELVLPINALSSVEREIQLQTLSTARHTRPAQLSIGFVSDQPDIEKAHPVAQQTFTKKPEVSNASHYKTNTALSLRNALEAAGLDRVHIGVDHRNTMVIVYDNRLHNWSQVLALGALLKTLGESSFIDAFDTVEIYTQNLGVILLGTSIQVRDLKIITRNAARISPAGVQSYIKFKQANRYPSADWFFDPRTNEKLAVTLTLAYRAYYGTEWDNWDYSMALRPIFRLPLWRGAHVSNVYHVGSQHSHNFKDDRIFSSRTFEDQLNELMIHQTAHPYPGLANTLSAGQLSMGTSKFKGWMNQGEYQAFEGHGRLYWRQGSMTEDTHSITLDYNAVGVEANWQSRNLTLGIQAGRYIEDDKSRIYYGRARLGNAVVGLGLTQSDITWKRVDVTLMFPLGPRKNYALGPVTVGGDPLWFTGMGTVLDNPIAPHNNLIDINPGYKLVGASLGNSFNQAIHLFDNGRLTPAYMQNNLNKLLDAIELAK